VTTDSSPGSSQAVEDIRKLGKLARLALTDDECSRFSDQAERIIGYFRKLQALDLKQVEPTSHVVDIECFRRPDSPGQPLVLSPESFPYLKYGHFQVPRVIRDADGDRAEEETRDD
jgi:aspartyl-tRNA(Asn)/glutamyl-tRNA(Gln) amidotransferase subunit C